MKRVAGKLAMRLQKLYREVMGWVQVRMSFAILRAMHGPMHLRNELKI